ncbi:cupin domain-containing protein [Bacillus tianshenii]|nr:cupin domain-containing protein [Bacillus tianshenii]
MYDVSNMYPNPYYVNVPAYMPRNDASVLDVINAGISGEAAVVDLYRRLEEAAPNEEHKRHIRHALKKENGHLQQLTELYHTLTGKEPEYAFEPIGYHTYREGLQRAFETEMQAYEQHRQAYYLTQSSPFQDLFFRTCQSKSKHVKRFYSLLSQGQARVDYGSQPYVVDIEEATKQNDTFRTALWTGEHLQVTLMSIDVGEDIGLEIHPTVDQFLRIEEGQGLVKMGDRMDQLTFEKEVFDDDAIMVPAGKWHNLINTGEEPLKLYTIYAPPEHPFGTVHETKADALEAE